MNVIRTVTLNPTFDFHYFMERFEAKKENYVQSVTRDAGGKGINTSRALTVNGVENIAYVIVGKENGAEFTAELDRVGQRYVPLYTEGRIRENVTLHPDNDKETRISLDTFSLDETALIKMEDLLANEIQKGDLISFSGRLPRGVSKDRAIQFVKRLIDCGARVIVDSNSLTPQDLIQIHPWFIKPNEQEIEAFLGRIVQDPVDAANAACELVIRGVAEEVMISLGGDGAVWSNGKKKLILTVPKLDHPVSTIGAGDSTLAGLLAATAKGVDCAQALCMAVSYGTAACMTEGTQPPRPQDVAKVLKAVSVRSV